MTGKEIVLNEVYAVVQKPWIQWLLNNRYVRFGTVGLSGTVVNLAVLFVGQEYLFKGIQSEDFRLTISLVLAIFCATVNNFIWNRIWTWSDRKEAIDRHFFVQLGQYFIACWVAIALQFVMTTAMADYVHYIFANLIAIAISSVINFFLNDAWTFKIGR